MAEKYIHTVITEDGKKWLVSVGQEVTPNEEGFIAMPAPADTTTVTMKFDDLPKESQEMLTTIIHDGPYAEVELLQHAGENRMTGTWIGERSWPIQIARGLLDSRPGLIEMLPWPLEYVGEHPFIPETSIYRRTDVVITDRDPGDETNG